MATDPTKLKTMTTIRIGSDNDRYILECADRVRMLVCAWGNPGELAGRGRAVLHALGDRNVVHLGRNENGHPKHPLYRPYATPPETIRAADLAGLVR